MTPVKRLVKFTLPACFLLFHMFCVLRAQTWQFDASPTRQNLARLDLVSEKEGWAVSYDGLLLHFDGKKWQVMTSIDKSQLHISETNTDILPVNGKKFGDIYTIRAASENSIWLAINNADKHNYLLVHFDPQNQTFSSQSFPVKFRSFDFWQESTGAAVGENGGYLFENGLWTQLQLPVSTDFRCAKFVGKDKFYLCGEDGIVLAWSNSNVKIIETPQTSTFRDMDFISENEGWIVGNGAMILHYKDGELEEEIAESTNNLWAVDMLSAESGFAVGENGTILQYNGAFWDIVPLNTDIDLHDIEMLNSHAGYIVGGRGAILKYGMKPDKNSDEHTFLFSDQVHIGSENLMDRITDVYGVTVADFNGDNRPDAYVTGYKSLNHLLINQGQGYYQNKVIESGTGGNVETRIGKEKYEFGSIAADFDRDGDTDLFLGGRNKTSTYFINNGAAVFTSNPASLNSDNFHIIDGAVGDLNEDGYPDFALADAQQGLRIQINQKYNRFEEQNLNALGLPATGIRAVKIGDLNGDFHQDILVVYQNQTPIFLFNDGSASWSKNAETFIVGECSGFVNSITIADLNIDGYNDFFLCTQDGSDGLFIFNPRDKKFYNETQNWGLLKGGRSYSAVSADFDLNGYPDLYITKYGTDQLYLNDPGLRFNETTDELIYAKAGYISDYSTGAALDDIENNGSYDIIVGNAEYWSSLLQNQQVKKSYIQLKLIGIEDTREALGARIWVWNAHARHLKENLIAHQEVILSTGLFSQNINLFNIGLGVAENVDIRIRFLNGDVVEFANIVSGSSLEIYQADWLKRQAYAIARTGLQFLHSPKRLLQILRFLFFLLLIFVAIRFLEKRYSWRFAHATIFAVTSIFTYVFFMSATGLFYEFLPFAMLASFLGFLMVINEPLYKTNRFRHQKKQAIQEATVELSMAKHVNDAFNTACRALAVVQPYKLCVLYVYNNVGNYFIQKAQSGAIESHFPSRLFPDRLNVERLVDTSVMDAKDTSFFQAEEFVLPKSTQLYPLVRKNIPLGILFLQAKESQNSSDSENIVDIKNLFLQLSIALDNIRINDSLREQENIAAIGTYSGGIIHNLKNPIEGLRLIVEILKKESKEDNPHQEYIDELSNGIAELKQRLLRSVEMIHINREMRETVDINTVLKKLVKNYANFHYADFELSLSEGELNVAGDSIKLEFVFENILQNAIEASKKAQSIQIKTSQAQNNMVLIEINDHGCGIDDVNFEKVFELFYSTRGKSRGLGLTLTKNIIKNHNGYIDLYSKKNEGTQFKIFLPIQTEKT